MGQTVNVSFEIDYDVKKGMEEICSQMGISVSAAFGLFAKKISRERKIPFDISEDKFYSENNVNYLKQVMKDVQNKKAHFAPHKLIEV